MYCQFEVAGEPRGKARPRAGKYGMYNPETNAEYEAKVKAAYLAEAGLLDPVDGPVRILIRMFHAVPKSASKRKKADMLAGKIRPLIKSDADNCAKIIMDALNKVAYLDDKQVVDLRVVKHYSENPRVCVLVEEFVYEPA